MDIEKKINEIKGFKNLELLASQVVEGFISGMHKSPFHGFSAEFAEHKVYNPGESTKHIDWKLYAKTDRLYAKRYEEETNLRCHLIVDNSASMHYPERNRQKLGELNKIGFATLAAAVVMNLLKRQRDAVGLSVFAEKYEFYATEKGSERHHQMLLNRLNKCIAKPSSSSKTEIYTHLHLIAEKMKRRSMVFLFSDMLQTSVEQEQLFEALRHLKYNKHEVVLFHVIDKEREVLLDFNNTPRRFLDVETGTHIDVFPDTIKDSYNKAVADYFSNLKIKCGQYRIKYVEANVGDDFSKIMTTYLIERQKF